MVQVQKPQPRISRTRLDRIVEEVRDLINKKGRNPSRAISMAIRGNRIRLEIAGHVEQYVRKTIAHTDTSEVLKELGF